MKVVTSIVFDFKFFTEIFGIWGEKMIPRFIIRHLLLQKKKGLRYDPVSSMVLTASEAMKSASY
jgi:hypothetical protein